MPNILKTLESAIQKGEIYVQPDGKTITTETVLKAYRKRYILKLKAGKVPVNQSMEEVFNRWLESETMTIDLYTAIKDVLNPSEEEDHEQKEDEENADCEENAGSAADVGHPEPLADAKNPV